MSSIGQGGPSSPLREEWPAPIVVLEALTRFVAPETIRAVLTQTGRHSQSAEGGPVAGDPPRADRVAGDG